MITHRMWKFDNYLSCQNTLTSKYFYLTCFWNKFIHFLLLLQTRKTTHLMKLIKNSRYILSEINLSVKLFILLKYKHLKNIIRTFWWWFIYLYYLENTFMLNTKFKYSCWLSKWRIWSDHFDRNLLCPTRATKHKRHY